MLVIVSSINSENHSGDRGQGTEGGYYPLPPPSWCCIFATCYYWSIWWDVIVVWYLVVSDTTGVSVGYDSYSYLSIRL